MENTQSVWGKTRYFKHRKYQNLCMNNKLEAIKNAICLRFLPHLQKKNEFFVSQGSAPNCLS